MQDIDIVFSRTLLAEAHKLVKKHFPQQKLYASGVYTYHFMRDHWEFHGPEGFYWHGSASNAYEARYNGWMAFLKHKGLEE